LDVYRNQPALRQSEHLILFDLGIHLLDVAHFLFGPPRRLRARKWRIRPGITGEDVATVVLDHGAVETIIELSFASVLRDDAFPQTTVLIEGTEGSLELRPDYILYLTTREGSEILDVCPQRYSWADERYAVVHASIVPCQRHLLLAVTGQSEPETPGAQHVSVLRAVDAAYRSADADGPSLQSGPASGPWVVVDDSPGAPSARSRF